jgi:hypothetical protein
MSIRKPANDQGYAVGYKRPPQQHQFKKGVSGNPRGRPRKAETKPSGPAHAELDDILLKEALRPITLRENDQVIEIPMIQAVFRSLGVAAVKGHHRSQLALANMVKQVQAARYEDRKQLFQTAAEYKDSWREAFAECDRRGDPRPEPVPHPDEIILELNTMEVRFNGPATDDEKAHWDSMLKRKAQALEEIAHYRQRLKRPGRYAEFYEAELRAEEEIVKLVDTIIPDEATRRRPGFDIRKWRESRPGYEEFMAKARQSKRRGSWS